MASRLKDSIARIQQRTSDASSFESAIPRWFCPERYRDALDKSAGWWSRQIGNRLGLQATLRAGQTRLFRSLSVKMLRDPFADIGFEYRNASNAPTGARTVSSVIPLTFRKSEILAQQKERIGSSAFDSCDDALASAAMEGMLDLLSFTSVAHLSIDLEATNKQILQDFKLWLLRHRRKALCPKVTKSDFTQKTLNRWHKLHVLPYFDVLLWAEYRHLKVGPTQLGEWLGKRANPRGHDVTGINAKDFLLKKVVPAAKQAFSPATHKTLYTLSG